MSPWPGYYDDDDDSDFDDEELELLADMSAAKDKKDEPLPGWVPSGTAEWETSSRLSRAGDTKMMGRKIAEVGYQSG